MDRNIGFTGTFTENPTKLFTEFDSKSRDRIAAIIENNHAEHWLAPTVENFIYGTTRALDIGDYHGTLGKLFGNNKAMYEHAINKNADLFNWDEINELYTGIAGKDIPRYLSFRSAAMHVNHNSHDPNLAIGLVFDAEIIKEAYDDTHIVILFGVDRMKAPGIARTLITYPTRLFTSMGCSIKASVCTCCGKKVIKEADFCNCLRYSRGMRKNGVKVAELLKQPEFYEQSIVTTPACSSARVLDAISEILPGRILKVASLELPDQTDPIMRTMANIYHSIKIARTAQEKKRLSNHLDGLIHKLEEMLKSA